jgi:hypothetical protein
LGWWRPLDKLRVTRGHDAGDPSAALVINSGDGRDLGASLDRLGMTTDKLGMTTERLGTTTSLPRFAQVLA